MESMTAAREAPSATLETHDEEATPYCVVLESRASCYEMLTGLFFFPSHKSRLIA